MSDIPRKVQPTTRANKCASEFLIQKGEVDVCNSLVFKIRDSWEQPEPTHQEKVTVATTILWDATIIFSL